MQKFYIGIKSLNDSYSFNFNLDVQTIIEPLDNTTIEESPLGGKRF